MSYRRLGIPYIWTDSLCILQSGRDAGVDWLYHSYQMHKIYLNCELILTIDVVANPHKGAFRSRDPELLQDCYVWAPFRAPGCWRQSENYPSSDLDATDEELPRSNPEGEQSTYFLFTSKDFSRQRYGLPSSQRAWLSKRNICLQDLYISKLTAFLGNVAPRKFPSIYPEGSPTIYLEDLTACIKQTTISEITPEYPEIR